MQPTIKKSYYPSGKICQKMYIIDNVIDNCPHRLDGPAYIEYFESGKIYREAYYVNGERHRINNPTYIEYYESGQIKCKAYSVGRVLHRLDGPAWIQYYKSGKIKREKYYIKGVYLPKFDKYYLQKENFFYYIQKYPEYIKEVEFLARHNNWLNEKELELLICMDMFR